MAAGLIVGGLISVGTQLWASNRSSNEAKKQANAANEATEAQYGYDLEAYRMASEKLAANHADQQNNILLQQANERKLADFKDQSALRRYSYDLMIRNKKQESLDEQFLKSNQLYDAQIDLNTRTANDARDAEFIKYQELQYEAAFQNDELLTDTLISEGQVRARGQDGRSASK